VRDFALENGRNQTRQPTAECNTFKKTEFQQVGPVTASNITLASGRRVVASRSSSALLWTAAGAGAGSPWRFAKYD
jgi:hypothetical protein